MCVSPLTIRVEPRKKDVIEGHTTSNGNYIVDRIRKASECIDKSDRCVAVPCGKCVECLQAYQNSWMIRMYNESLRWKTAVFFTLTIADEHIRHTYDELTGEEFNTVCKDDVQKWLKRGRIALERTYGIKATKDKPIMRYFITSEYGPKTLRPHYHGVVFFDFSLWKFDSCFFDDWRRRFGFVRFTRIDKTGVKYKTPLGAFRYVGKYCSKGMFENPLCAEGKVEKTFHLVSKGLGLNYVEQMRRYHLCEDIQGVEPSALRVYGFSQRLTGYLDITHKQLLKNLDFDNVKLDFRAPLSTYFQEVYESDYLDEVISRKKITILHSSCSSFDYKMPRYYADKIYGAQTALRTAMQERISHQYDDSYSRKLADIQASSSVLTPEAAEHLLIVADVQNMATREREAKKAFIKFYNKSVL